MHQSEALKRLAAARVGRFATYSPEDGPHIVPVTFTVVGMAIVHMVDGKPKTTTHLKRIANLGAVPAASLLVDHYEDEWDLLWWVRVDGATTLISAGPEWEIARAALADKYSQYEDQPPEGPAIYLSIDKVSSWESTG
jgi:PPOX class probable F420-dependent enzyme